MSDDKASFEVELKDRVSPDARSAAAGFRLVHKEARGTGILKASRDLSKTEKHFKRTERAARSYGRAARKTGKVNPFFGGSTKNSEVFRSPQHVGRLWDEMVRGHDRFAAARSRSGRRGAGVEGIAGLGGLAGTGAMAAGALAVGGGIAAYETGKATLSAVRYRDEALKGLELITRSQTEANAVFERSVALSDELGQHWQTTVGGMQKLLAKGFDEGFATDLTKGIADLSIVAPDANIDNLLLAIGQIKTAGKLQGDELNQLTEAGLNSALMFEVLEKRLGKNRKEVLKLKESGKLLADDVLPAILESIQNMTGKELGAAAAEANRTVAGQMRKLEQLPGRFFLAVAKELDDSELDSALGSLLEALDPQSEAFSDMVTNVADGVNFAAEAIQVAIPLAKEFGAGLAESLSAFLGLESTDDFFEMWRDPDTLAAVREWGQHMGTVAGALAKVIEMAARFGPAVADTGLAATKGAAMGGPMGAFIGIAQNITDGFVNTLFGGQDRAHAAGAALGQAAIDGARSREGADVHSPSRKAAEVGGFISAGTAEGLEAGVSQVERAGAHVGSASVHGMASSAKSLPAVDPGSAAGAAGSGNSGGMQIGDISIPLQVLESEAGKDPEALARAIRRELATLLDGFAQQGTIQ